MPAAELVLQLQRTLPAPPETVFAAFTDPERLARWWGPEGFAVSAPDFDPQVGNDYAIEMRPPDADAFRLTGRFSVVEPPRRLAFTFVWEPPDADDVETTADLHFDAVGSATRQSLTQGPFATEERRALHRAGWGESLDKLERLVG